MDTKHFKILQEMTSRYAKMVLQCKYWRIELSELKGLKQTRFLRLCDVESLPLITRRDKKDTRVIYLHYYDPV